MAAGLAVLASPGLSEARTREVPASLLSLEKRGMRVGAFFAVQGREVASHRADVPLNPASVTKVFTAALALATLGADATVETRVVATGRGERRPVLAVVGSGDPMLTSEHLREMAACVRDAGIGQVARLVVDTGPFNHDALPPAYDRKDTDAPYRAGVGGLQVDFNRLVVTVTPGKPGAPPEVRVDPASAYVRVVNEARTARRPPRRRRQSLGVTTGPDPRGGLTVRVTGTMTTRGPVVVAKRVPNPATHAGFVFRAALEAAGVRVEGGPEIGRAPEGGLLLCRHRSPAVRDMLVPMLKESQNQVAESLLRLCGAAKSPGRPVGFREGAEVLRAFLTREVGLDPAHARFTNGSGLYDANAVTARAVVRLLDTLRKDDWFRPALAALPVAGVDGTLKNRLKKTPWRGRLRAKTGTLDGVVTLAGTADLPDGRPFAFAILVQGQGKISAWAVRKAMDDALIEMWNRLVKTPAPKGSKPASRPTRSRGPGPPAGPRGPRPRGSRRGGRRVRASRRAGP